VLAQRGALTEAELLPALRSFRQMQVLEPGDRQGCLRWYWEETVIRDTNAAFFIGLGLQMLWLAERPQFSPAAQTALREIMTELAVWFEHELATAHPRYPNKCMGDLVCGWLAAEVLEREPSAQLQATTRDWCDYWRREHWGWGEHMSDGYTGVLLMELSAVLLFAPRLPGEVRVRFTELMTELLAIEDAFAGGPRVPAIRSYAFEAGPPVQPFRDYIRDASAESAAEAEPHPAATVRTQAAVLSVWFARAGWSQLDPGPKPRSAAVEIPCRDQAVARAVVHDDIRVGAMSHYPIMTGVDHPTWGLSWQTFPAALWRPAGDWAFWRWVTRSGEIVRAHPAIDKHTAYLGNALALQLDPPPVPRMRSTLGPVGHLEMERVLPLPAESGWDEVTDAFCLLDSTAEVSVDGSVLTLRWPERTVLVRWIGNGVPVWEPAERGGWWTVRLPAAELAGHEKLVHRWELRLGGG
jgi:hypothetical protein